MIANTTSISQVFKRITTKFDGMFSRKAMVHWYVKTGMEEGELYMARENLALLEADYREAEDSKKSEMPKSKTKRQDTRLSIAMAEKMGGERLSKLSTNIQNLMSNLNVDEKTVR